MTGTRFTMSFAYQQLLNGYSGRRRQRRGVLLLIVLSLLVLFLLIGLSFMVSAGQFSRLARSASKTDKNGTAGHKLADTVLYQVLRGTNNPYSSLRGHSLLEDLYGRDYLIGAVTSVTDDGTAQQVQTIGFDTASIQLGEAIANPSPNATVARQIQQATKDDYYAGSVLTFIDGPAKGKSTRVVSYKPTSGEILIKGVVPVPSNGSRFLINGRPFNGTGAGYNYETGRLDLALASDAPPVAYLPHIRAYQQNAALTTLPSWRPGIQLGRDGRKLRCRRLPEHVLGQALGSIAVREHGRCDARNGARQSAHRFGGAVDAAVLRQLGRSHSLFPSALSAGSPEGESVGNRFHQLLSRRVATTNWRNGRRSSSLYR